MKDRIKRVISISLLTLFITQTFNFVYAKEEISVSPSKKAYDFLTGTRIIDKADITYSESSPITREDYVKMCLQAINAEVGGRICEGNIFSDVTEKVKNAPYIEAAYEMGIVNGIDIGVFGVGETITFAQAEKILVSAIGYNAIAKSYGGYPKGYNKISNELKITKGVSLNSDDVVTISNAVMLVKNALECKCLDFVGFENGKLSYTVDCSATILSQNHNIESIQGIVNANEFTTTVSQTSNVGKTQIRVGNIIFEDCLEDSENFFGLNVKLWYDYSDKTKPKALYAEETGQNYVLTYDARDVEFSSRKAVCERDEIKKTLTISDSASYIVNGKWQPYEILDLQNVNKGSFTFISNDGDNTVDIILVTKYDTYLVQGVSDDGIISTAVPQGKIIIDLDDDERLTVYKNGDLASIGDIKSNDVILVAKTSGNGVKKIKILASDNVVTGNLSSVDEEYISISGQLYLYDSSLATLNVGKTYDFYFDDCGIVSFAKINNSYVYGYLYGVKNKEQDDTVIAEIFTENNRWVKLKTASKVRITENALNSTKTYKDVPELYELLSNSTGQIVRYNVNANAEIVSMEFAKTQLINSAGEQNAIEKDLFRLSYEGSAMYGEKAMTFGGIIFADPAAKIFYVPADEDKERFSIGTMSSIGNNVTYSFKAYDADDMLNVKIFQMQSGEVSSVGYNNGFMIVKSKSTMLNDDEEVCPALKVLYKGKEVTFPTSLIQKDLTLGEYKDYVNSIDDLGKGDVIQAYYNGDGEIRLIKRWNTEVLNQYNYGTSALQHCTVGIVRKADVKNQRLRIDIGKSTDVLLACTSEAAIYLYDSDSAEMKKVHMDEILTNDKLIIRSYDRKALEVIIIR